MTIDAEVDRSVCRTMVEEYWRSFLSFPAADSGELGKQCLFRFHERINELAATMSDQKAQVFLAAIEEERALMFDEYSQNPDRFKKRLGIGQSQSTVLSRGQNLGDIVVTTATRSTIWESVLGVFHTFR